MSLKENKNIVYFLGAGFTKAIVNTAPVGTEFFIKAFDSRSSFITDEKIRNVKQFIEKIYYPLERAGNCPAIEDVLSLIDYSIQRKEALSGKYLLDDVITVRNNLIYLIGRIIRDSIGKSPEKIALSRNFIKLLQSENSSKVSIISSNYDIIIDNALLEVARSCKYGVRLRKNLFDERSRSEGYIRPLGNTHWGFCDAKGDCKSEGELNEGEFQLLKIHGSLNWFYCPKCKELDITVGRKEAVELAENQGKYLCVNEYCTANYEPLLVTPTMLKIYSNKFLLNLWRLSEKVISQTAKLIFIGYSLPVADYHIRSLMTKAFAKNERRPMVVIVEKKPENAEEETWSEEVKKRYTALLGKDIDFQPIGFEKYLEAHLARQTHNPLS